MIRWLAGLLLMTVVLAGVTGCTTASGRRHDVELIALAESARAAYEQGLPDKASILYGQAYQRGLLIGEAMEAGRNAYNAALCYLTLNQMPEAAKQLGEARRLLGPDAVAVSKVDMAEAEMMWRAGNRKAAGDLARRVLGGRPGAQERCQAAILLAEIALGDGDVAAALSWYKVARGAGSKTHVPLVAARREGVGAQLIQGGVLKGDAGDRYTCQATFLRDGGAYGEMARVLLKAGDAYAAASRFHEAFVSYERAVNTWVALGDSALVEQGISKADDLVGRVEGEAYGERVRLMRELMLHKDVKTGGIHERTE